MKNFISAGYCAHTQHAKPPAAHCQHAGEGLHEVSAALITPGPGTVCRGDLLTAPVPPGAMQPLHEYLLVLLDCFFSPSHVCTDNVLAAFKVRPQSILSLSAVIHSSAMQLRGTAQRCKERHVLFSVTPSLLMSGFRQPVQNSQAYWCKLDRGLVFSAVPQRHGREMCLPCCLLRVCWCAGQGCQRER